MKKNMTKYQKNKQKYKKVYRKKTVSFIVLVVGWTNNTRKSYKKLFQKIQVMKGPSEGNLP